MQRPLCTPTPVCVIFAYDDLHAASLPTIRLPALRGTQVPAAGSNATAHQTLQSCEATGLFCAKSVFLVEDLGPGVGSLERLLLRLVPACRPPWK